MLEVGGNKVYAAAAATAATGAAAAIAVKSTLERALRDSKTPLLSLGRDGSRFSAVQARCSPGTRPLAVRMVTTPSTISNA